MLNRLAVWIGAVGAVAWALLCPLEVFAVGSGPVVVPALPSRQPQASRSAEAEYNAGLRHKADGRLEEAVADFRRAVALRSDFPEAWNELGFSLRRTGKYTEALEAYDRALRLRPNFPEALEYLGEAYVSLGRMDQARAILDRLRSLDTERARELEVAIQTGP